MQSLPKIWKWVLGILVTLNMVSLALLWVRPHPPGGHPQSPEELAAYFQKEIGLDNSQKDAFTALIKEHRQAVNEIQKAKKSWKDQMFQAMTAIPQDSALVASFAGKAAEKEEEMDLLLAEHFRDLQAVCKENQKEKLGRLFKNSLPKPPPHLKGPN